MEMKDVILRIIFANLGNKLESTPHYTSAREIAEMMKEFIEWMTCNHIFRSTNYSDVLYTIYGDTHEYTIDELFTYWKETVYKKQ